MQNFLSNIGWPELIIIGLVLMLFLGSQKLNDLARGLGESKKELQKIKKEIEGDSDSDKGGDK